MVDSTVGGTSNEVPPAIKEQDRLLPIANVGRIMKQMLPTNAKISKDAKETMQECVSEFIGFVTSEASEKCRKERRKTVSGDDICWALRTLGFDDYAGPMKRYLNRYREIEGDKSGQERAHNNSGDDNMDDPSGSYPNPFGGQQPGSHEDEGSTTLRFNMIGRTHSSSSRPY